MNVKHSVNICLLEKKVGSPKGFGCIYFLDELTLDWIFGLHFVGFTICITYATKDDDKTCCVTDNVVYFHSSYLAESYWSFKRPNSVKTTLLSGMI